MKAKNSRQWGYKGRTEQENKVITKGKRGKVIGLSNGKAENIDNIKYAHTHLSLQEYNRRIKLYTKRALARLSLFDNTRKKFIDDMMITRCSGCELKAPKRSHLHTIGWVTEVVHCYGKIFDRLTVTWCPTCYKEESDARNRNEVYK